MLAVLELEIIGDNYYSYKRTPQAVSKRTERYAEYLGRDKSRPWVARLIGLDPWYGFQREFVKPQQKDYSQANSIGSRGVFVYYTLEPGIYEVNKRETWSRVRRYFIQVDGATVTEISRNEVMEWLRSA